MIHPIYNTPVTASATQTFSEDDYLEDPERIIGDLINEHENCPISTYIGEMEKWLRTQLTGLTRDIDRIFIHCTGTATNARVSSIVNYWKNNLGWRHPGYHLIFPLEGFTALQDLNLPSNGVRGYNARSIHLCTIGGLDQDGAFSDTRNNSQQQLLHAAVQIIHNHIPNADILGHNEVSNKACPCYDARAEFAYLKQ